MNINEVLEAVNTLDGESVQLDNIIILLDNLLDYYALCFNNDKEKEEYYKLQKCLYEMIQINETYGFKYSVYYDKYNDFKEVLNNE